MEKIHIVKAQSKTGKEYTFKLKGDLTHFYNMIGTAIIYGHDVSKVSQYIDIMTSIFNMNLEEMDKQFKEWLNADKLN